jgi:hypothetical protein
MTYLDNVRVTAHRSNISRYLRLLSTHLTELERDFVYRRLREEQSALTALMAAGEMHRTPSEPYSSRLLPVAAMVAPET